MTDFKPALMEPAWVQALHSSDSAWIVTDENLGAVLVNQGFTRMFGYELQDLQGQKPLQKLLATSSACELAPHIQEQLRQSGKFVGELHLQRQDGSKLWVAATINTLQSPNPQGKAGQRSTAEVIVLTDIGFSKRFEQVQREVLQDIVQEKPLPLLMQRICLALEGMLPRIRVSVLAVDEGGLLHTLAAPSIPIALHAIIEGLRIGPEVGACGRAAYLGSEVVCADLSTDPNWRDIAPPFLEAGLQACWSCPIQNHDHKVIGTFALYFDTPRTPNALHQQLVKAFLHLAAIAMERDSSKYRIQQLAYYDTLTHLPNRVMFNECAQQALHQIRGNQGLLFFLDLDRFKLWNDSLGHAAGDALLQEIAVRLGLCTRPEDVVGRLSSDEFAVLMPNCTAQQIPEIAQRMLHAIAEPFSINGIVTTPNACIGVCTYPEDGTDVETLLRHADQAMYAAKKQGSHLWQRYKHEMGKISQERADLEHALRQALCAQDLELHFQPQVLHTPHRQLYGVEALARWHHPEWGWVPPMRFIATAEDSDLIHPLTAWLIKAACTQLAQWRSQGLQIPHIAINLSTNNFHDPAFAQKVNAALQQHGLAPKDLMLEITESVMLDSSPATMNNLKQLHELGMRLSMDDFGTGYSSLSYLHRLPITELKLDKSFVQDVGSSPAASALTRSVLNIASSLNMTVVAEGVETEAQAQWLTQHQCPVLQGYLFAKPMPGSEIAHWIAQHCSSDVAPQ